MRLDQVCGRKQYYQNPVAESSSITRIAARFQRNKYNFSLQLSPARNEFTPYNIHYLTPHQLLGCPSAARTREALLRLVPGRTPFHGRVSGFVCRVVPTRGVRLFTVGFLAAVRSVAQHVFLG